jgi:DNA-binding XRE family transcriptional regulator
MGVVLVKNANRMMAPASLLDNGIELSFADGFRGLIPYADVPEVKVRAGISGLERPDPYEMVLQTAEGERVEVSWDFARHYCDASYRPTAEAMAAMGRQALGGRVRRFRGAAGLTQVELARAAHVGRVTLVRIENGEQTPRFKTMDAIAQALGIGVPDLLFEPELLMEWKRLGPPWVGVGRGDAGNQ